MAANVPARILVGTLVLWVVAAVGAASLLDTSETRLLLSAFIALTAVASLTSLFANAGAALALVGVVTYSAFQFARSVQGGNYFPQIVVSVVLLGITAGVADFTARRLRQLQAQLDHDALVIDELTLRDTVTGALKRQHAERMLIEEVSRCRRYNHALSLLLVGVKDWDDVLENQGAGEAQRILREVGPVIVKTVRSLDHVSNHGGGVFSVLLVDTPLAGALVVANKLRRVIEEQTGAIVHVGIAEFPNDAVTSEDLVAEAEAALQFARTANVDVVSRNLLEEPTVPA